MNNAELSKQYIDLLKKSLLNELYIENELRLLHTFHYMLNKYPLEYKHYFNITKAQPEWHLLKLPRMAM